MRGSIACLALLLLPAAAGAQLYGQKPDYDKPALYLKPGPQSAVGLTPEELRARIGISSAAAGVETMAAVFNWMSEEFGSYAAGGALIGKTTADGLIKDAKLSGCHDWALLFSAVMRRLGYPALMADAAGIKWARGYRPGGPLSGHVFAEVYLDGRWFLVDPASGRYMKDYDPRNPVIPMEVGAETEGLYVMFKGADPRSYGIAANDALGRSMKEFSVRLPKLKLDYPAGRVLQLPRGPQPALRVTEEQVSGDCLDTPCRDRGIKGRVLQSAEWDILAQKDGGVYYARLYPASMIFNRPEAKTMRFETLRALNAWLASLK